MRSRAVVPGVPGEGPNRLHGVQLEAARREGCVDYKWPLGLPVGYVVVAVPRSVVLRKVELLTYNLELQSSIKNDDAKTYLR